MAVAEPSRAESSPAVPGALTPPLPRTNRLILANIWVAVLAFGVAAAMAMMQAMSRANLELPYSSARMYYMSVTAHGVDLVALVLEASVPVLLRRRAEAALPAASALVQELRAHGLRLI